MKGQVITTEELKNRPYRIRISGLGVYFSLGLVRDFFKGEPAYLRFTKNGKRVTAERMNGKSPIAPSVGWYRFGIYRRGYFAQCPNKLLVLAFGLPKGSSNTLPVVVKDENTLTFNLE